jgi:hypothetical protein
MTTDQRSQLEAPPALLAIIQAARRVGDRSLELAARRELSERHGIDLIFRLPRPQRREAVRHA